MTAPVEFGKWMTIVPPGASPESGIPVFPKPDLSIGISRSSPQENTKPHSHDFFEIVIVESGTATHHYSDSACTVRAGDAFVIRPHHTHLYDDTDDFALTNVTFYDNGSIPYLADFQGFSEYQAIFLLEPELRKGKESRGRLHLNPDQLKAILALTGELSVALSSTGTKGAALAYICFLQLIKDLCAVYRLTPPRIGTPLMQIGEAVTYLELNYNDPLPASAIAKQVNMSPRSFQRHFRLATGMSIGRYLTRHRIKVAQRLLCGSLNVTEAAFRVGFQDSNYFSRVFREQVGTTPKQYQIKNRSNKAADSSDHK